MFKKPLVTGSVARALALFQEAAVRVPAYKDFLRKAKIKPGLVLTKSDFEQVPPIDKQNYISAYSLKELSWDGTLTNTKYVSSSSGSTGVPFYWPRGEEQNNIAGALFQRIFEDIFETKKGTTLFVNMFSLGTWIAGLEFYNAAKYASDAGSPISILTPGIEKIVAINALKKLLPLYDRIILAGYPPFIKDVLEFGADEGLEWKKHDVRVFTGGESFSEVWRTRVLALIGKPNSLTHIINLYGMAETGIVGHETPLTIALRRLATKTPELKNKLLYEGTTAALYQYNPNVRYFEVGDDHSLLLTARAGLPLVRYNTRDQGGLLTHKEAAAFLPQNKETLAVLTTWRLPSVYLYGRRDLSISFYALMIYVENIKHCLESFTHEHHLSGLFVMQVTYTKTMNQRFEILIELARGVAADGSIAKHLTEHITRELRVVNSEFAKLHDSLGARAIPSVKLLKYGEIETVPGRKHRWVKKV